MKDDLHLLQTPHSSRKSVTSKSAATSKKHPPKKVSTKKNLSNEFTSVSDDGTESLLSPPFSNVFDGIEFPEGLKDVVSSSLEMLPSLIEESDFTPMTQFSTNVKEENKIVMGDRGGDDLECLRMRSLEAEVVINHLKQARLQVLDSKDLDYKLRKLISGLIELVMEEFYGGLGAEEDIGLKLISARTRVVFTCLFFLMMFLLMAVSVNAGTQLCYAGPRPT